MLAVIYIYDEKKNRYISGVFRRMSVYKDEDQFSKDEHLQDMLKRGVVTIEHKIPDIGDVWNYCKSYQNNV